MDAKDKEASAPPSCGSSVIELYNNVRLHSTLGNKTPAEARRALELSDGTAPGELATPEIDDYQTQGLSL
jgi:hypothetical protein